MALQITRIKPNPTGKDRNRYRQTPAAQLAAEWVDFRNDGATPFDCSQLELWHRAYHAGQAPTWDKVMSFKGTLPAGKTVRVHSGSGPDNVIRDEDRRERIFKAMDWFDLAWRERKAVLAELAKTPPTPEEIATNRRQEFLGFNANPAALEALRLFELRPGWTMDDVTFRARHLSALSAGGFNQIPTATIESMRQTLAAVKEAYPDQC